MTRDRLHFLLLNIGHFLDHFFMLVFATAAALALVREWNMGYAELIPYATPSFVAMAVFAIPAGWLADRWSREGMITIFFIGIGLASIATALAETPLQIALGLFAIGFFGAIYHPVGIALVVRGRQQTGVPLAINGIWGNLGVASAALVTGFMIDQAGWRAAFVWPGALSVVLGFVYYARIQRSAGMEEETASRASGKSGSALALDRTTMIRVFAIVFASTALGGLIFQSTTFALPEIFNERLASIAGSATEIGWYAFVVFAIAAMGQLVVGYLVDRNPVRYVFMGVAFVQAALFAVMPGLGGWAALLTATVFMLAVFGQIPINDVLIARITASGWRSRVYAVRHIVTFSVTASTVPLIAWIYGNWGFGMLFMVLAAAAACILAAVMMLPLMRTAVAAAE